MNKKVFLKSFILIFTPFALLTAATLFIIYKADIRMEKLVTQTSQKHHIALEVQWITGKLESAITDIMYLANHQKLVELSNNPDESVLQTLQEDILLFARQKELYNQISFLDMQGGEVIRIDYSNNDAFVAAKEELQEKAHSDYFQDILKLARGDVYISRFDLNERKSAAKQPAIPVLRIGALVFDNSGNKVGVMIINFNAAKLMSNDINALSAAPGIFMLINADGCWLYSPDPGNEYCFKTPDKKARTFYDRYAGTRERILGADTGQFHTDDGVFTFATIYPSPENHYNYAALNKKVKLNIVSQGNQKFFWKLVSIVPSSALDTDINVITQRFTIVFLLLIMPLFFVALIFAKASSSRRHAEEALREGWKRYRHLVEFSPEATVVIKNGNFAYINNACLSLLGGTHFEQFIGRALSEYISVELRQSVELQLYQVQNGEVETSSFETRLVRGDGRLIDVEAATVPITHKGKASVQVVFRDVTEEKRVEESLRNIALGIIGTTSAQVFNSLAKYLAKALKADYVFIGKLLDMD